jgi:DNA invertase Pin-like site-specific DNA recombinase
MKPPKATITPPVEKIPKVAIYSRVSTLDKGQSTETQTHSLSSYAERMGWEYETFEDYASGKDFNRPKFQGLKERLRKREFDILLVSKIDRLSRSVIDFCTFTLDLDSWGIRLIVLEQAIDTDKANPMSRLLITILIAFAEFEREMIRDRTRLGIANARRKGKHIGGHEVQGLDVIWDLVQTYHKNGRSTREIAKILGRERGIKVTHMTLYRRLVASGDIVPEKDKIGGVVHVNSI